MTSRDLHSLDNGKQLYNIMKKNNMGLFFGLFYYYYFLLLFVLLLLLSLCFLLFIIITILFYYYYFIIMICRFSVKWSILRHKSTSLNARMQLPTEMSLEDDSDDFSLPAGNQTWRSRLTGKTRWPKWAFEWGNHEKDNGESSS